MENQVETQEFMASKISNWSGVPLHSSNTKNVLLILPWMEMGGADKFNLDVLRLINKEKFSTTVVCTVRAENRWRNSFEKVCKDIHVLAELMDIRDYAEYISFLLKSRAIDIVFLSGSYYGYYLLPWIRVNFPKVAIVDYVHMAEWYWRNGGYARLSGLSGAFIEKTMVCNHATNKVLINIFGRKEETVDTVYIGVDEIRFDPEKIEYGHMRKKYGIANEKKVILFPCRIHPQKRPFLMVEIAKRVVRKVNDVIFFVAGDGPQYKELLDTIKKENLEKYFVCPGEITEMETIYRDSDLTLICSIKEGLALTVYESCAMSIPVITADVGGQKELIDDSVGRLLPLLQDERDIDKREYSDKEIDSYVDAIQEILENPDIYQEMVVNCRRKVEQKFTTKIMINEIERQLLEAIEKVKNKTISQEQLLEMRGFADNYLATYVELERTGNSLKYGQNMNEELKRIANSKWGKRVIQLMMKLKLNRIFR